MVLVSGTVIYSKGDDRDVEKMAAEEIESLGTPSATATRLPGVGVAVPGGGAAAPMHIVGSAAGKVRVFRKRRTWHCSLCGTGDHEYQPVFDVAEALVRWELANVWGVSPPCSIRGNVNCLARISGRVIRHTVFVVVLSIVRHPIN